MFVWLVWNRMWEGSKKLEGVFASEQAAWDAASALMRIKHDIDESSDDVWVTQHQVLEQANVDYENDDSVKSVGEVIASLAILDDIPSNILALSLMDEKHSLSLSDVETLEWAFA